MYLAGIHSGCLVMLYQPMPLDTTDFPEKDPTGELTYRAPTLVHKLEYYYLYFWASQLRILSSLGITDWGE